MGNRTYSHLNKIGIAIIVVSVILLLFGLYILPSMGIFTALVLFLLANWMKIRIKMLLPDYDKLINLTYNMSRYEQIVRLNLLKD